MKRLLVFVFAIMPFLAFATDEICPAGYQPAEYIELEYIESTGTQYIDTGISSNNHIGIQTMYNKNYNRGGPEVLFGATNKADVSIATGIYRLLGSGYNRVAWGGYQNNTVQNINGYNNNENIYAVFFNKNKIVINGNLVYTSPQNDEWSFPETIFIFARNTNGKADFPISAKLYYFKIFSDDNMIRDFIPVRWLSDNAVGMYDRVEGKFYGNDGTGEFVAGPEKTGASFSTDENDNIVCESCPANTYKPNAGNESCTKCPTGTFSPVGSTQLSDCAKILRVKDYVVYMPLGKRTEHGLCVMSDGKKYCADVYERQ